MNVAQTVALENHCRLGCETALPEFCHVPKNMAFSLVLSVNSGYE